ncbi:hypothetical protein EON64_19855 [archaeon]|nr:MAG: hypothetical protein EON64_19855 [archaeon]
MSTIKYRQAYSQLGDEREQSCPDSFSKSVDLGSYFKSEEEVYWAVRRDYNWSKLPGVFKYVMHLPSMSVSALTLNIPFSLCLQVRAQDGHARVL